MALLFDRPAITGATGFLGGHLARELVRLGHRPLLLARSPRITALLAGLEDLVEWARLDLAEPVEVANTIHRYRPSILFHLAGTRERAIGGGAVGCAKTNVLGTVALLDAAHQAAVRRIVMVSSADVFDPRERGPVHENLPLAPTSYYGISSAAACQFALAMHRDNGCPVVILRLFSVYGPHQPDNMFLAQAIRCAVLNLPFAMTEGRQRRDLIYVDDVLRAFLLAAIVPDLAGQVLHLGSGTATRLRDVATLIWRLSRSTGALNIGARPALPQELHDTWADSSLAKRLLGWQTQVPLQAGLQTTLVWARQAFVSQEAACPKT